ncbi:SAM-dependent methyltransferase [Vibrio lentus]|uniref:SAM-dependent methyltransferase n=1 Tax=Vibrio lentus TaxID=136468 RepID=UPI000C8164DB|nr:SAM-dependent methyltransferase [Vibrio lentus]PMJ04517.1 hypothetical protein BCU32_03160 [Vibrio lentus]
MSNSGKKITFVGISYSNSHLTKSAIDKIKNAKFIVGHEKFVEQVNNFIDSDATIADANFSLDEDFRVSRNKRIELSLNMLDFCNEVVVLTSGDSGIFSTAGDFLYYFQENCIDVDVDFIPGIPAYQIASSQLDGPLLDGFSLLPLCEDVKDKEEVRKNINYISKSNLAIVLYKLRYNSEFMPNAYKKDLYPHMYPSKKKAFEQWCFLSDCLNENFRGECKAVLFDCVGTDHQKCIMSKVKDLPTLFEESSFNSLIIIYGK